MPCHVCRKIAGKIRSGAFQIFLASSILTLLLTPLLVGAATSQISYTASKGAVKNLTKGMCADWARYGLQINALAPGYFATPLTKALMDDPVFDEWLRKHTPGEIDQIVLVVTAYDHRIELDRRKPLIVIEGHDAVVITPGSFPKQGIGRQWVAGKDPLCLSCACSRKDDARLFISK